jgi:hypothetical protein
VLDPCTYIIPHSLYSQASYTSKARIVCLNTSYYHDLYPGMDNPWRLLYIEQRIQCPLFVNIYARSMNHCNPADVSLGQAGFFTFFGISQRGADAREEMVKNMAALDIAVGWP